MEDADMKLGEQKKEGDDYKENDEKKVDDDDVEEKIDEGAPMEVDDSKEIAKDGDGKDERENDENNNDEMDTKETGEEEGPPKVELTEDEEKMWFRPQPGAPDLTSTVLSQNFAYFTIPEKDEGFDDVRFEWQNEDTSKEYLRKWVLEKKLTSRIEELQPSQWFKDKLVEWQKTYQEWQQKQKTYKGACIKDAKEEKKDEEEKKYK